MLFRKLTTGIILAALLMLSACAAPKGSIMILENGRGTGFTMDLKDYTSTNKCEMSLAGGDVLQVEVEGKSGAIALTVIGKNGSEPYTGNDLEAGVFTFTVFESDAYMFKIIGKHATGKVTVKNLGSEVNQVSPLSWTTLNSAEVRYQSSVFSSQSSVVMREQADTFLLFQNPVLFPTVC